MTFNEQEPKSADGTDKDKGSLKTKPHANNNAESGNKQGYRQALRRGIKAFIGILYCRRMIPFSWACWTIRKIGGCHD